MDKEIRTVKRDLSKKLEHLAKKDEPRDAKLKKCAKMKKKGR